MYLGEQAEPACWSFQFGGSLTSLPSPVCKAGDVLVSGKHRTSGILTGHLCFIFCLQNVASYQPFVHMGSPALPCCTDGRAQWSSGNFTSSHSELLWPVVPVDVLSQVQAYFACRWAKKQMQRMQGLSQPLPTSEQLWAIISMNFSLVNL